MVPVPVPKAVIFPLDDPLTDTSMPIKIGFVVDDPLKAVTLSIVPEPPEPFDMVAVNDAVGLPAPPVPEPLPVPPLPPPLPP